MGSVLDSDMETLPLKKWPNFFCPIIKKCIQDAWTTINMAICQPETLPNQTKHIPVHESTKYKPKKGSNINTTKNGTLEVQSRLPNGP